MWRIALFGGLLVGCIVQTPDVNTRRAAVAEKRLLLWDQLGYLPAQPEQLAEGPSAVAVAPDGSVVLLDRLRERLLRLVGGEITVLAKVPRDAEDLAAGPDGALAVYSPLRARVWVRDDQGQPVGEMKVPRVMRQVREISLGPSRQVLLGDAHQHSYVLGSPSVPQTLEALLHGARRGAVILDDGTGVVGRLLPDGRPELQLVEAGPDRQRIRARFSLGGPALAVRVMGRAGSAVCARIERQGQGEGPALAIQREVVCLHMPSGEELLRRDLPPPGTYHPRRELAVGGSPPRLAVITPEPRGLRLQIWPLEVLR